MLSNPFCKEKDLTLSAIGALWLVQEWGIQEITRMPFHVGLIGPVQQGEQLRS